MSCMPTISSDNFCNPLNVELGIFGKRFIIQDGILRCLVKSGRWEF